MCCYGGVRMRKNRNNLSFTNLLGFFIVSILGCINHFIYELSGKNTLAASITPINESTWEHLKLLFFPFIAYIIFEFFIYGKHISGFLFSCSAFSIPCTALSFSFFMLSFSRFTPANPCKKFAKTFKL